jgi:hypothetical protein
MMGEVLAVAILALGVISGIGWLVESGKGK